MSCATSTPFLSPPSAVATRPSSTSSALTTLTAIPRQAIGRSGCPGGLQAPQAGATPSSPLAASTLAPPVASSRPPRPRMFRPALLELSFPHSPRASGPHGRQAALSRLNGLSMQIMREVRACSVGQHTLSPRYSFPAPTQSPGYSYRLCKRSPFKELTEGTYSTRHFVHALF